MFTPASPSRLAAQATWPGLSSSALTGLYTPSVNAEHAGDPTSAHRRRLRLRYAGVCDTCGAPLAEGNEAFYDPRHRTVQCLSSSAEGSDEDAITVDAGTAGGSAAREYERRVARRGRRWPGPEATKANSSPPRQRATSRAIVYSTIDASLAARGTSITSPSLPPGCSLSTSCATKRRSLFATPGVEMDARGLDDAIRRSILVDNPGRVLAFVGPKEDR